MTDPVPFTPAERAAAHATLHDVLAQRAFAQAHGDSWLTLARRAVSKWFGEIWGRQAGPSRAALGWTLVWIVSLTALAVLLVVLARALRRRRLERPLTIHATPERRAAGRELALEAAALARAGRTREASRLAYRAALRSLEEDGSLAPDDTRTPRESLRLLTPLHRRRPALSGLTARFERIWYASEPPAPDEGPALIALLQDMECLSREHAN